MKLTDVLRSRAFAIGTAALLALVVAGAAIWWPPRPGRWRAARRSSAARSH